MKKSRTILFLIIPGLLSAAPAREAGKAASRPVPEGKPGASVTVDISDSGFDPPPAAKAASSPSPAPPPPLPSPADAASGILDLSPEAAAPGVEIGVEPGASVSPVDGSRVRLLAPFPARPLGRPPAGWRLVLPEKVTPFLQEVTLASGSRLKLSIRPHVLVPDADGSGVIAVGEPGYEAARRYDQAITVGAALSRSLEQMEQDAARLDTALGQLQELLSSLPQPPPPPPANPPRPASR